MKSVRIGASLEARLQEVARMTGDPVSRIIRQAIEERCELLLGDCGPMDWETVAERAGNARTGRSSRSGTLRQ